MSWVWQRTKHKSLLQAKSFLLLAAGHWLLITVYYSLFTANAQPVGRFLTDSIEIGRPFRYSLTYRHAPTDDVLFPDTARAFAPYQVQAVAVFATQTGPVENRTLSRDSAVYTLLSFETDAVQTLRVPVRLLTATDCTDLYTQTDTVFLRSRLPAGATSLTLVTATELAPLQQQFNYVRLGVGVAGLVAVGLLVYALFGRLIRRQWRLFRLNRRYRQFLRDYNRLSRGIRAETAADTANEAVVLWKAYLERLERRPFTSLTTPEIADRMNDERVLNALREADRMIYGGAFSAQSQPALRVLSDVAQQAYHRRRRELGG